MVSIKFQVVPCSETIKSKQMLDKTRAKQHENLSQVCTCKKSEFHELEWQNYTNDWDRC